MCLKENKELLNDKLSVSILPFLKRKVVYG